jgi:hypothetical protein
MLSLDPAAVPDAQSFGQWLDSIPYEEPAPPPLPTCGQCQHHRSRPEFKSLLSGATVPPLEYCTLRAGAGIESRIGAFDPYAQSCPFYVETVEF